VKHVCLQIVPSGKVYKIRSSAKFQGYVTDLLEFNLNPRMNTIVYIWKMTVDLCCHHPPSPSTAGQCHPTLTEDWAW